MADGGAAANLPEGSAPYYVVRFAPAGQRGRLVAAFAFAAELERSVERSTDPGVTRLKLDWWRQELQAAARSPHPLVRQLAPLAATHHGRAALQRMLDAAEADVRKQQPTDAAGFHAHCRQAGALARLLTDLDEADEVAGADVLGQYSCAVQRIQALGRRLRRDHNPLPRDSGLAGHHSGWDIARLSATCDQLLAPLADTAQPLLRSRQPALSAARRWAAQAHAVHRLLRRERYAVRDQHLDITPLARLWAAWRVR